MVNATFGDLVLLAIVVVLLIMIVCKYNKKNINYCKPLPNNTYVTPNTYTSKDAVYDDDTTSKGLNDIEGFGVPFYEKKKSGFDNRWLSDVYVQLDPTQVLPGQEHRKQVGSELMTGTKWHRAVDHSVQNPSLVGHFLNNVDAARENFK
jgi:hypothetical protein